MLDTYQELQLTHPRGVRQSSTLTTAAATRLQLTLPCRERLNIVQGQERVRSYNSRSPAESDEAILGRNHRRGSYNSRSPAESDVNKLLLPANDIATTPALLRRATPYGGISVPRLSATTHALLRRATSPCEARLSYARLQLTLSCGERLCLPAFTACSLVATTPALLRRTTACAIR